MKSLRFLDRRAGFSLGALGLLFGMIAPSVLPVFVSAATLTSRSVAMSDSSAGGTAEYTVTFTTSGATQDVVLQFCDDSPIIPSACNAPSGMDVTGTSATYTSSGGANLPGGSVSTATSSTNIVKVTAASASSGAGTFVFTLSGITNPSSVEPFYARIYTYAGANDFTDETHLGTTLDTGGVALSTTSTIGVSAAVKETMTFCVTKTAPSANCSGAGSNLPGISLGHGSPLALDSSAADTAINYAEISTNAAHGATVYMKNSNACGGLARVSAGVSTCDITPEVTATAQASIVGTAKFGMNVGSANTSLSGATGTTVAQAPYATSGSYGMDWVSGNATGVGSTYGSSIFTTNGTQISNVYVPLTFAASVTNTTPAGAYSANMNLIATGTF